MNRLTYILFVALIIGLTPFSIYAISETPPDTTINIYINQGYLDAAYNKSDSQKVIKGELYTIGVVTIDNSTIDYTRQKLPFSQIRVEAIINQLNQKYQNDGFYFNEIKIEKVVKNNNTVDLSLSLNKGPAAFIRQFNLIGLKRSRQSEVLKYFDHYDSSKITASLLEEIERQADRIDYLKFVKPLKLAPLSGYQAFDINLTFTELKQFYFKGVAGVVPNLDNSFVWDLNFSFNNIFGGGRKIEVITKHPNDNRNNLMLSYSQPLFLIGHDKLKLELSTRDYRESFYEFIFKSSYTAELNRRWKLLTELSFKDVKPDQFYPSYRSYSLTAGALFIDFDNDDSPLKGSSLDWSLGYSYRRYTNNEQIQNSFNSINEIRNDIKFDYYLSIHKSQSIFIRLNYLGLETKESLPPLAELYFIGGPNSLRGFRNEQFPAIRSVLASVEPQFVFSFGRIYPFVDMAYISNRVIDQSDNIAAVEDIYYGYGFGLRLLSNNRQIDLSFGWNKDLSFDQPRLSIELLSGF